MDYVCIQRSRGGVDGAPESVGQLLDAQVEGTTTWDEMYDVCYADLTCVRTGQNSFLGGRSWMRVTAWSMSMMSPIRTCVY